MDKERFSLLLLEPNEIYFEDFLVDKIDSPRNSTDECIDIQSGHLKMCSKSVVFDPKDKLAPIIKIVFKDCTEIYHWPEKLQSKYTNVLAVKCTQWIEMLEQNILTPYRFRTDGCLFLFSLKYARVEHYLNQLCQLHRASSLTALEQNDMIATIVYSRYKRMKFNPLWLDDIYETAINDCIVDEINPLVLNPGRLLLTLNCVYLQPYNNIKPYPVQKITLKSVTSLVQRRFLLRHTGLEINWKQQGSSNNCQLYVSFRNEHERNIFFKNTMSQENLQLITTEPESMTLKWQNGLISNYDYLLYLNSLADRTFQDLTQYPIFPWVISNYQSNELDLTDEKNYRDLSKPIGALTAERLVRLKERCEDMDNEAKFLYGSHYSAPALVLFYLVRKYPKLMLCLQNGRFDHPDRMFNDIDDAYRNCMTNMADFKELIPEFYDIIQKGDFLLNKFKINFGCRHDGTSVNNVHLPPWANGSPKLFVEKLRLALESDFVSKNLCHWIDLIFGYKQRGKEAIAANNLFHPLCYEGAINLDGIKDNTERHALEVQISEFGQIPKQLFDKPHVPKLIQKFTDPSLSMEIPNIERQISSDDTSNNTDGKQCDIRQLDLYFTSQSHRDVINCILIDDDNNVFSTGKDGLLKCYNLVEKRQIRSVAVCGLPLSCCVKIANTNTIVIGSWDNTILTYDLDYGRVSNIIPAHDDAVSCLSIINELNVLVSGSWDCSVKVWKGFDNTERLSFRMSDAILAYLPLEEKISCIHAKTIQKLCTKEILIAIGTFTGDVHLWILQLNDKTLVLCESLWPSTSSVKLLFKHETEITAIQFNLKITQIAACSVGGKLQVCDIETGMILFCRQQEYALMCLDWSYAEEILCVGNGNGHITIWNMLTGSVQFNIVGFENVVSGIATSKKARKLAAAGIDGTGQFGIRIWNC